MVIKHFRDINNFKILASGNTDIELLIKESLLVDRDQKFSAPAVLRCWSAFCLCMF